MTDNIIERAIERFDFEKVHGVMEVLKRKWYVHAKDTIPTIGEMKQCVRDLYYDIKNRNDDYTNSSTGGFTVTLYKEDDIDWISLVFTLEHIETD
jgi:hypothetical protein